MHIKNLVLHKFGKFKISAKNTIRDVYILSNQLNTRKVKFVQPI